MPISEFVRHFRLVRLIAQSGTTREARQASTVAPLGESYASWCPCVTALFPLSFRRLYDTQKLNIMPKPWIKFHPGIKDGFVANPPLVAEFSFLERKRNQLATPMNVLFKF